VYQLLSESAEFVEDVTKTFGLLFSWTRCTSINSSLAVAQMAAQCFTTLSLSSGGSCL